jgi:3-hydroxyisobutyrate dehydrogenase
MRMTNPVTYRVGYVGLGNMGGGIAVHLAQAGVRLIVYDIDPQAVARVVAEGAEEAASPAHLAAESDIVIICVLNSEQLMAVLTGRDGILESSRPGQIVVIQSTVPPQTVLRAAQAAESFGVGVIDAPVSGSFDDRRNGTLAVIVGGADDVVARCRPVLEIIGNKIRHVGPLGAAEVAKLVNNAIMHTTRLAAIEAMRFAASFGVSEEMIRAVAKLCSANSWVLDNWEYFDQQTLAAMGDDAPQIRDILEAASDVGVDLPLCRETARAAAAIESNRRNFLQGRSSS